MPRRVCIFLVGLGLLAVSAAAQDQPVLPQSVPDVLVRLGEPTILDDMGAHIEGLERFPEEALRLPDVDTTGALFLSVFYTHSATDDPHIAILVLPDSAGRRFYIDRNNDEDLTNDGPSVLFRHDAEEVAFTIRAPNDPKQQATRIIGRAPHWLPLKPERQRWFDSMFDEAGHLNPLSANLFNLTLGGRAGTFYFDRRLNLRRGQMVLGDTTIAVGLWDWTANGRYDDDRDRLVIDGDGDGELEYNPTTVRVLQDGAWVAKDTTYVFNLDDVFFVAGQSYRLTYVDPYGRGLRFAPTTEVATNTFAAENRARWQATDLTIREEGIVTPAFWDTTVVTIDGDSLALRSFEGRYVLLNAWGEWCAPCLHEMPDLVYARQQWADSVFVMLGLLATTDLDAARTTMRERSVTWPQIRLNDDLRAWFGIESYPTNVLLRPDRTYIQVGMVNRKFFETYLSQAAPN